MQCMVCVVQGMEVVVTLHRWWECFFLFFMFFWKGVGEETRRGGGRGRGKGKGELRVVSDAAMPRSRGQQ